MSGRIEARKCGVAEPIRKKAADNLMYYIISRLQSRSGRRCKQIAVSVLSAPRVSGCACTVRALACSAAHQTRCICMRARARVRACARASKRGAFSRLLRALARVRAALSSNGRLPARVSRLLAVRARRCGPRLYHALAEGARDADLVSYSVACARAIASARRAVWRADRGSS
eukprot:IDg18216t1